MLERFINVILKDIYWSLAGFFLPIKPGAVILAYHSVANNNAFFTVTPEVFEKHMKFLRENHWNIIPLTTLVSYVIDLKKIPQKTVVITFDDAYVDFIDNALPILETYEIPATVFVPTKLVGKKLKNRDQFELSVIDWAQLEKLVEHPLVSIGSHTKNHPILTEIAELDVLQSELRDSKEEIEQRLNIECNLFAYPKGICNDVIQAEAGKIYTAAVGTKQGRIVEGRVNIFDLYRNGIYQYTTFSRFKLFLKR